MKYFLVTQTRDWPFPPACAAFKFCVQREQWNGHVILREVNYLVKHTNPANLELTCLSLHLRTICQLAYYDPKDFPIEVRLPYLQTKLVANSIVIKPWHQSLS